MLFKITQDQDRKQRRNLIISSKPKQQDIGQILIDFFSAKLFLYEIHYLAVSVQLLNVIMLAILFSF